MPPRRPRRRSLSNFLSDELPPPPDPSPLRPDYVYSHQPIRPHLNLTRAERTFVSLISQRDRFAAKIPTEGSIQPGCKCDRTTRAAVLAVYGNAFDALEKDHPRPHHAQIAIEATRKIKVVLGLVKAEPDDLVFLSKGQYLAPLEPHFANPRIDWEGDEYAWDMQTRLDAWREDGWPSRVPVNAIEAEKEERKRKKTEKEIKGKDEMLRTKFLSEMDDEKMGGVVEMDGSEVGKLPVEEEEGVMWSFGDEEGWDESAEGENDDDRTGSDDSIWDKLDEIEKSIERSVPVGEVRDSDSDMELLQEDDWS
ncbi:hypothetical protein EK21DRAFT_112693 [Setomelanomma holmii]|uniref:Uncharacterized protein n=1 Tax=Setomelanomma holmii TaxID=210430 RepID=A0A9P4H8V0_9PLEO|nr:hypothetical protein EK21DRAFT_112693 [Setomelanomma holmii]